MNTHGNSGEDLREIFGEPIFTYSRAQALEDGVLVDLSQFPISREHYRESLVCTSTVWAIIQRAVANPRHHNDLVGVIHDVLWMSRVCRKSSSADQWLFDVKITGSGRQSLFTFKMVHGYGDSGEPTLTLMLPEED